MKTLSFVLTLLGAATGARAAAPAACIRPCDTTFQECSDKARALPSAERKPAMKSCNQAVDACRKACRPAPASAALEATEELTRVGTSKLFVRSVGGSKTTPCLLVITGGPGISSEVMRPFEALASPKLRVVSYDARGVGRSTMVAGASRSVNQQREDVELLRAALGHEKIHVLGHSFGGLVAASFALAYPDRVASLILVDSMPLSTEEMEPGMARLQARIAALVKDGTLASQPPRFQDDADGFTRIAMPAYFADPKSPAIARLLATGARASSQAASETWRDTGRYDLRAKARDSALKVLVVQGEGDPLGKEWAEALRGAFAKAVPKVVYLKKSGHFPFWETPTAFFAVLRTWLGP